MRKRQVNAIKTDNEIVSKNRLLHTWLSEEYLNNLPWRKFSSGGGLWIYVNEAPQLAEKLMQTKCWIRFGNFVYRIKQGEKHRFIHRCPVRNKTNN